MDVSLPQPEPRPGCVQSQIALLTESWYKAGTKLPSAEMTREKGGKKERDMDWFTVLAVSPSL